MPSAPAQVVEAETGKGGEKPGGEVGVGAKLPSVLIETDERFDDHIFRVAVGMQVAPGERPQRLLPAHHDPIEREVVAQLQLLEPSIGFLGFDRHGGERTGRGSFSSKGMIPGGVLGQTDQGKVTFALLGFHQVGRSENQGMG